MASEDEYTLLVLKECFVYKIPPRTSASGYYAEQWNITNPVWTGRLTVTSTSGMCFVRLIDVNTNAIFATSSFPAAGPSSVEQVVDSSRYFAVRIEDGRGNYAYIGIGFSERDDAFQFKAALQDFLQQVAREKEIIEARQRLAQQPQLDLGLRSGETVTLNLRVKTGDGESSAPAPRPAPVGGLGRPPTAANSLRR